MNVLDASDILAALWADGPARAVFDEGDQRTLHLADFELLNALVTADARIEGAPGIRCPVTVVPR